MVRAKLKLATGARRQGGRDGGMEGWREGNFGIFYSIVFSRATSNGLSTFIFVPAQVLPNKPFAGKRLEFNNWLDSSRRKVKTADGPINPARKTVEF